MGTSTQGSALIPIFPHSSFLKGRNTQKEMGKRQIREADKVIQSVLGCISGGKRDCLTKTSTFRREAEVMN